MASGKVEAFSLGASGIRSMTSTSGLASANARRYRSHFTYSRPKAMARLSDGVSGCARKVHRVLELLQRQWTVATRGHVEETMCGRVGRKLARKLHF